jgi:hypothetical protein
MKSVFNFLNAKCYFLNFYPLLSRPLSRCQWSRSPFLTSDFPGLWNAKHIPPGSISAFSMSLPLTILTAKDEDFISLTDMLKAKDGEFFISDWLRNRNTVEFLGIWESVHNPGFNSGEFAIIKSKAGLNSYKLSVKDWVEPPSKSARPMRVAGLICLNESNFGAG